MWQTLPGEMREWSHWEDLGPAITRDPAVAANADGRLVVFAVGSDGRLGHMWQISPSGVSGWSEWNSFGFELRGSPVVARSAQGTLELFAIGEDDCLGHVWQERRPDGATDWAAWGSFGVPIQGVPAVVRNRQWRPGGFRRQHNGLAASVKTWQQLAAPDPQGCAVLVAHGDSFGIEVKSAPAVCHNRRGALEVFAIGADGTLGHLWQAIAPDGSVYWSRWGSFGIAIQGDPAVGQDSSGQLAVTAAGPDGNLGLVRQWQFEQEVGWGAWHDVGPKVAGQRVAIFAWRQASADVTEADASALATPPPAPPVVPGVPPQPSAADRPSRLSADFCVVGAGPAGITLAGELLAAGASVVLIESGDWHETSEAQALNHGDADGPIIKGSLKYLRLGRRRQVQGSAVNWGGWCMPFRPLDFQRRDWVDLSGWPFAHDELAPFERRATETFGFGEFETPPLDGPLMRLSYQYPPNLLVFRSNLMGLARHPALTLETGATAVELERQGDRIESVRVARFAGDELRVTASTVVVAAGGIENARLLLLQDGVPESHMLGRCFMDHPHVLSGTVHLPEPEALSRRTSEGDRRLDVLSLADSAQRDERLLNASVQLMPSSNGSAPDGEGVSCELFVRSEQAPNPDSRVVLGDRLDQFGCRQLELQWELLDQDWITVVRTAELVAMILSKRYGASADVSIRRERPWPAHPADPAETKHPTWGNHHLGTTRMSSDPGEGVVDPDCRVHGLENLYVAGSSVFPTGGCANPTFTIVAMAHRLADHLTAAAPVSA